MATLDGLARQHLQTAYVGLHKYLHQDRDFVQRVIPDIGIAFQEVEDALMEIFFPDLFQGDKYHIPGRDITGLLVKHARIALPNPTWTAGANWMASCVIMVYLIAGLRGTAKFRSRNHALLMGKGREEIRRRHMEEAETTLGEA